MTFTAAAKQPDPTGRPQHPDQGGASWLTALAGRNMGSRELGDLKIKKENFMIEKYFKILTMIGSVILL